MRCRSPILTKNGYVPCGKCAACLSNYRAEMCFRLRMEYYSSNFGLFLTLTYDDEHRPPCGLNKRDAQLFLKRLRKNKCFPPGDIRYFLVGEYGDRTHREHYHCLLLFKKTLKFSDNLITIITNSWQNGFVDFGEITDASIVYCTKYAMKRSLVPKGKNDVFRLMSKMNGGLGSEYLERFGDFHLQNMDFSRVSFNGYQSVFPRYFKRKLLERKDLDPETYQRTIEYRVECKEKQRDLCPLDYEKALQLFSKSPRSKGHQSFDSYQREFCKWYNDQTNTMNELTLKHVKHQSVL